MKTLYAKWQITVHADDKALQDEEFDKATEEKCDQLEDVLRNLAADPRFSDLDIRVEATH